MRKQWTRILALLMSVCMAMAMLPIAAMAAEDPSPPQEEVSIEPLAEEPGDALPEGGEENPGEPQQGSEEGDSQTPDTPDNSQQSPAGDGEQTDPTEGDGEQTPDAAEGEQAPDAAEGEQTPDAAEGGEQEPGLPEEEEPGGDAEQPQEGPEEINLLDAGEEQPTADEPENSLDIPGYTRVTSAELETDRYYIIVSQDSEGNLYALYPAEGTAGPGAVDKMTNGLYAAALGTSGSDLSATYLLDGSAIEDLAAFQYVLAQSDSGYTLCNKATGLYLSISSAMFSTDAAALSLSVSDGVWTIGNAGRKLDFNKNGDSKSGRFSTMTTNFWGPADTRFPLYLYTLDNATVEFEMPEAPARVEGTREYVQVSDEIASGYYAIRANGNTMYCKTGSTTTDQCGTSVAVSDGKLTMDAHPDCHVWLILNTTKGYVIQSMGGGSQYLNWGTDGEYNHLPVSDVPAFFQITPAGNNTYYISWTNENGDTYYVSRGTTSGREKWGTSTQAYAIELYLEAAPKEPEEPEKPEPPAQNVAYEYQQATGEIENGYYAIVGSTAESDTARPRIMHCEASYSATNQCMLAASEYVNGVLADTISLGCGDGKHVWQILAVDGGYTIQSMTGPYLQHGTAAGYNHLPVGNASAVFDISPLEDGGYAISWEAGESVLNLAWNSKWGGSADTYTIYLYKMTEVPPEMAETHFSGVSYGQPLIKSDTGSYFRIPAMITLDNGWILASSDIRWRGVADNPSNIDTIASISKDGGETWEWDVYNYFSDHATTSSGSSCAAFIDPSYVQTSDGKVWMIVDATPAYGGLMSGNRMIPASSKYVTGFDDQGRMLVGHITDVTDATYTPQNGTYTYDYYVDLQGSSDVTARNTEGETVTVYPICSQTGDEATGYYVDAFANTYYDYGEEGGIKPVLAQQTGSSKFIHNNLFYLQSEWKVPCTFYLMVRSATITDTGLDWGEPAFVNVKKPGERFTGVCPGRGAVTTYEGKERIIFPLYDNATGNELASVIWSDDGGVTWTRGERSQQLNGSGKSSESQVVVLPDGTLRMYSRNTAHYLYYADSTDGGATWGAYVKDEGLQSQNPGNGCMMSFINVDGYVISPDNEVYGDLIMACYPRIQRKYGIVRIGSYNRETGLVEWLDGGDYFIGTMDDNFSYSCLAQLQDSDGSKLPAVSVLAEYNAGVGDLRYLPIDFDKLLGEGWYFVMETAEMPTITASMDLVDLYVGRSKTVTVELNTEMDVTWASSDEAVATVDNGVITAVSAGKAYVTATVTLNGVTRTATVEVIVQDEGTVTVPDQYEDGVVTNTVPAYTNYELDTDGLEDGVYAIFDAAGGKRILYHASGKTATDQWGGSASNGLLSISGTKVSTVLWTVTANEDGSYTLCSLDDGKYLNYGTSGAHAQLPVTTTVQSFKIEHLGDGNYTISWDVDGSTVYLDWNSKWGAGADAYPLQFFRQVDYPESNTYTATADGLEALIAAADAAGIEHDDYTDVLARAATYPTREEADAAQAEIDAAAQELYAKLRDTSNDRDPAPAIPASYTVAVAAAENGTVRVSRTSATAGAIVTVTVKAAEGYELESITVTRANGAEVKVTETGSGVRFVMPAGRVTVTAVFTELTDIEDQDTPLGEGPISAVFADVSDEIWYAGAVRFVYAEGLMKGVAENAFGPDAETNRGMVVTMLHRLENTPDAGSASFADVLAGAWYTEAVDWGSETGVVSGYGNGSFGPGDVVTREQLAVFLYRYARYKGYDVSAKGDLSAFADADSVSDWAVDAMTWAVGAGLIRGTGAGLEAQGTATRAEVAAVFMRFCESLKGDVA